MSEQREIGAELVRRVTHLNEVLEENVRLREAIRRLADQDATMSVVGGNVIVEMDATLTREEREAVDTAEASLMRESTNMNAPQPVRKRLGAAAATLQRLLDRIGGCKSVASRRCRETGGQPFDSAPITLSDAEREAVSPAYRTFDDWYCEVEGYSSRFERLDGPVRELRAAFAAGQSGMRLTDAEREAVERAADLIDAKTCGDSATLRELLERLG